MNTLPPFPAGEAITWANDELGKFLLGYYLEASAQHHGIRVPEDMSFQDFADRFTQAALNAESDSARNTPVEKSIHKALVGDFETAGKIFRDYLLDGADVIAKTRLLGDLSSLIEQMTPDAKLGSRVRTGSKKPRKDALGLCLDEAIETLLDKLGRFPRNTEIIEYFERKADSDDMGYSIQEIDQDSKTIFWIDRRGKEQKTGFKAFYNRVTPLRKKKQQKT